MNSKRYHQEMLKLSQYITSLIEKKVPQEARLPVCKCGSTNTLLHSKYISKFFGLRERYKCKDCYSTFTNDPKNYADLAVEYQSLRLVYIGGKGFMRNCVSFMNELEMRNSELNNYFKAEAGILNDNLLKKIKNPHGIRSESDS